MKTRNTWATFAVLVVLGTCCRTAAYAADSPVGTLYVSSDPKGAQVLVDDTLEGVTPCVIKDVPVGKVRVVIRKAGFADAVRPVKVKAGELEQLKFKLLPLEDVGTVMVMVKPEGSSVYLGHSYKGKTPCKIINVKAGTHTVRVTEKGFVPYEKTITVKTNAEELVVGQMAPVSGDGGEAAAEPLRPDGGAEAGDGAAGKLSSEEEQAFAPVRELIAQRRYEDAVKMLVKMNQQAAYQQYRPRILRDIRFVRMMQQVQQAALSTLPAMVGEEMEVTLRKGIRMSGTLTQVKDGQLTIKTNAHQTEISAADLGAVLVVRLAGDKLDRTKPATQAAFGVFYTAEGEYERAQRALKLAHGSGFDVTEAVSYLDAERARQKALEAEQARPKGEKPEPKLVAKKTEPKEEGSDRKVVLLDEARSSYMMNSLQQALHSIGFDVRYQDDVDYAKLPDEVKMLMFIDKGPRGKEFSKADLIAIRRFVGTGGSLFYVGPYRATDPDDRRRRRKEKQDFPGEMLMTAFDVELRKDAVDWVKSPPKGVPESAVPLGVYNPRHPINRRVEHLYLSTEMKGSTIDVPRKADVLTVTGKYATSSERRSSKSVLAATFSFGRGRVFVLSCPLHIGPVKDPADEERQGKRAVVAENDADIFLFNALKWMLHVRSPREYGQPLP